MNVNQKGLTGLLEVIRDLHSKGYECFTPIHDYSPVDLVVLGKNYKPIRLQVKYRETYRGVIDVAFKSMVNGVSKPIDVSAIDGWAIYCPEVNQVVYINRNSVDLTKGHITFRLTEGKNCVNKSKNKTMLYTEVNSELNEWETS